MGVSKHSEKECIAQHFFFQVLQTSAWSLGGVCVSFSSKEERKSSKALFSGEQLTISNFQSLLKAGWGEVGVKGVVKCISLSPVEMYHSVALWEYRFKYISAFGRNPDTGWSCLFSICFRRILLCCWCWTQVLLILQILQIVSISGNKMS